MDIKEAHEKSTFGGWYETAVRLRNTNPLIHNLTCSSLEGVREKDDAGKMVFASVTKVGFNATDGLITRGKNKGQTKWVKGPPVYEYISHDDVTAAKLAWEKATGLCHVCEGKKEESCGWDHVKGALLRPCRACGSTGQASGKASTP